MASRGSSESVESGTDANRVLKIQDKKQTISLLAPTVNECNLWLKRIESAKETYTKALSFNKVRPKSSKLTFIYLIFLNYLGYLYVCLIYVYLFYVTFKFQVSFLYLPLRDCLLCKRKMILL